MATVLLSDHVGEIKKHEDLLEVAITKLMSMKKNYMTSRTELAVAENYINTLREQLKEFKQNPAKPVKIPKMSTKYLDELKSALELDTIDTDKITADYIKRKGYN